MWRSLNEIQQCILTLSKWCFDHLKTWWNKYRMPRGWYWIFLIFHLLFLSCKYISCLNTFWTALLHWVLFGFFFCFLLVNLFKLTRKKMRLWGAVCEIIRSSNSPQLLYIYIYIYNFFFRKIFTFHEVGGSLLRSYSMQNDPRFLEQMLSLSLSLSHIYIYI